MQTEVAVRPPGSAAAGMVWMETYICLLQAPESNTLLMAAHNFGNDKIQLWRQEP
ncbi:MULTISPECIES: hypothetical protein [Lacrimispora]|uniref:hypothetical protein n=1 Tax=Lacrimispora TaxID=2719231 RepID=UPI0014085287|nr:hypothetical protein [Lacrimispora amygdalina]MDK2964677.1 hypothetical protein [Lacrimispora sp.]